MKIYLRHDGSVRVPAPGEYGHLCMATREGRSNASRAAQVLMEAPPVQP